MNARPAGGLIVAHSRTDEAEDFVRVEDAVGLIPLRFDTRDAEVDDDNFLFFNACHFLAPSSLRRDGGETILSIDKLVRPFTKTLRDLCAGDAHEQDQRLAEYLPKAGAIVWNVPGMIAKFGADQATPSR